MSNQDTVDQLNTMSHLVASLDDIYRIISEMMVLLSDKCQAAKLPVTSGLLILTHLVAGIISQLPESDQSDAIMGIAQSMHILATDIRRDKQ